MLEFFGLLELLGRILRVKIIWVVRVTGIIMFVYAY
jgi:hypothetical protein